MSSSRRLNRYISVIVGIAAISVAAIAYLFPPTVTSAWALAFGTLLALALLATVLALKITDEGSVTSTEFVPLLASVILLGPFGATILAFSEVFIGEFLVLKKPRAKAVFNTANHTLAIATASVLYSAFGGTVSLDSIAFTASFPPFIVAAIGYFSVNTLLTTYVISLAQDEPFGETWRSAVGRIFLFDLVMSSVAYMVAIFYVRWGAIALLAAIVPMFGFRYSYGVNIELHRLNQDLLRVLIKTLEARDQYTSGHSIRVSERAKLIARHLSLNSKQVRLIETGALLHDLGKIDLAFGEILRQAGPLTPVQRELIRSHPDKGVEILSAVRSIDNVVLQCVRFHHEWYDGTGYPTGIAGEDIPIGARIIMICDSVDAMLTDRPYRAALSVDDVRKELIRNSGTQFDPRVVDATFAAGTLEKALIPPAASTAPPLGHALSSS